MALNNSCRIIPSDWRLLCIRSTQVFVHRGERAKPNLGPSNFKFGLERSRKSFGYRLRKRRLTIKLAQKFNTAKVAGIDYWGAKWEYSKNTCESNVEIEGVNDNVTFQKAKALKLPFEDGFFDAAVSNLVFHEVADAKDKREVIKEALRVVKKGGKFAFQDLFLEKHLYGDTES